jgi:subtilisin family serine protease
MVVLCGSSWLGTVGTSFSTALVSGVAAQYLQTHPTATPAAVENWIIKTNATAGALQTTNPELAGPNLSLYTACQ